MYGKIKADFIFINQNAEADENQSELANKILHNNK